MDKPFPQKWSILFGVTQYKYVKPLTYCSKDIMEVGRDLRRILEFPDDHFLEFGEGLKHPPQLATFWHELSAFLQRASIGEDDLLLFYFSGHGFHDKKDYLLPMEASLNDLKHTAIVVEDLIDKLKGTGCKNVVTFLDACREAVDGAKGGSAIGDESKVLMERAGVVSIFSCDPNDLSWEIEELQHSSFTYCLLQAMRSEACTTVGELYEYLLKEVPLVNQRYGKKPQKPYAVIVPAEKKDLPIFASSVKGRKSTQEYDEMIARLLELVERAELDTDYYDAAVELLIVARERSLTDDENKKLYWIKLLCAGKVRPKVFRATWETMGRREAKAITRKLEHKIV